MAAALAGGGSAPRFWALRCCSCRRFQVQQAKRSGKWSCCVCGQRQAVQKIYGQGSGQDCRHHVQKLNLLQGEAEEAIAWTSWGIENSVDDGKNVAAPCEDSLVQQEGRAEVSRWSKYLDKESEDEEEEATTERQQLCSQRKNTVEGQRKHHKGFLLSDVQEHAEDGVFQLACQAKKRRKCVVSVPDRDDGDAASGHTLVPVVCEAAVPEETTQTPTASIKPSKWDKFLSYSDSSSKHAARAPLSPQEGSGRLGVHSITAPDANMASRCSELTGRALPPGAGCQSRKCVVSTQQLASKLLGPMEPSTSCSVKEDTFFQEPQSQLLRAGPGGVETTAAKCCFNSTRRANTFVNSNTRPKLSNVSCKQLFCTGDEFDDDL